MNSAKKALKGQGKAVEHNPKKTGKKDSKISKIMLIVGAVCVALLSIFIGYEQLHRPIIVKVNDSKVYLDDMMYYIYSQEAQGNYYSQLFGGDANSYWSMDAGDGKTIRDTVKQEILDQATQYEVLYSEATNAGYKLTAEEKKATASTVTSLLGQLTDDQKEKTGFTEENLTDQLNRMAVADQYKKDLIDGFDIDDEAIKATVDYDEYRQYDIQYYKVATATTDSDGNTTELSDAEKKDAYSKLEAVYTKAKTADDFTTLVDETDTENVVKYSGDTSHFTASADWVLGDDAKQQVMKLENNEISGIIEGKNCYFFVKMIDNNSSESYDSAVENAITDKETEVFDTEYSKVLKTYNVKVYKNEWKKINIGTITQ